MIKLSTKARYATRFLLELALNKNKSSLLLKDIADRQEISAGYLEQIVPLLKSSGLIIANRGPKGGYSLFKKPQDITLKSIIEAVEGPVKIVECINKSESCSRIENCAVSKLWDEINIEIKKLLESKTLAYLIEKYESTLTESSLNYII